MSTMFGSTTPNHAMVPHYSGTTLEAQNRYAKGVKDCLARFLENRPLEQQYLIVDKGGVVSPSYRYAFKMPCCMIRLYPKIFS